MPGGNRQKLVSVKERHQVETGIPLYVIIPVSPAKRVHRECGWTAVNGYLNGGSWSLIHEVVEVESGKRDSRPKLAEALDLCRIHGATLIIAKLDRLARNVAFLLRIIDSGVD